MKHFILKADPDFKDGPVLKRIPVDRSLVCKEKFHKIAKTTMVSMDTSKETIFPDLISYPILMISEKLMSVIQMYGDVILKRDLVCIDSDTDTVRRYFIVLLERLIADDVRQNDNGRTAVYIKRAGRSVKERNIFEIEISGRREIIVNLDVAESLLRRGGLGVCLEEVGLYEMADTEDKQ